MAAASSVSNTYSTFSSLPPSPSVIRCTSGRHAASSSSGGKETKGTTSTSASIPAARVACLLCQAYLCQKCDTDAHGKTKHATFPVSQLKSYIAFDAPIRSGESHIRRNLATPNGPLLLANQKATTLYENFQVGVKLHGDRACMGTRTMVGGKIGPYVFQSYKQVGQRLTAFGSGLKAAGVEAHARVGLYSVNRSEWVIAEQACHAYTLLTVPLYDTLGADAAEQVIAQAGISVVICSQDKIAGLLSIAARGQCPSLNLAIVMPLQTFDKPQPMPVIPADSKLKVVTFDQIEKLGIATPLPHQPPTPQDLCTLCYTSGTTGTPKGAMLTHANIVSDAAAASLMTHTTCNDTYVSYLPLAHVYERMMQVNVWGNGGSVGFCRGDPLLLLDDIEAFGPTIFAGVPRLYNRLYDKILAAMDSAGGIKKALFNRAFAAKSANLAATGQLTHAVWDRLVFGKIAAKLGGRCRLMVTGSAPIAANVMSFLRVCFSCPVVEGYGQTEGSAAATTTLITDQSQAGTVGVPLACVEIKLVDVAEMGYTSKDVINGVPTPRGEIWVRGSAVFAGYYKDAERTKEALQDGWLLSGDIAMWTPDGQLKIVDRKKNIFKLAQGEYIAPEKIENVYGRAKFLAQVYVHGDSLQTYLVAVVVPDEEALREWAKSKNIAVSGAGLAPFLAMPQVKAMIYAEMQATAKAAKLHGFEQARALHLHHELFTSQNGLLTPTFKLKREFARKFFSKEIDQMYASIAGQEKAPKIQSKL